MHSKPLVSICCATYNHERFIRNALDSFLMQEVSFPIEIVINDDASSDKTPEILQEYERAHPELINVLYQSENQYSKGIKPLLHILVPYSQGKYIAVCEGDDYWTDPLKLQKQITWLEEHPKYVMSFGNAQIQDYTGCYRKQDLYLECDKPTTYGPIDAPRIAVPHLTTVFRKDALGDSNWMRGAFSGDYFARLALSLNGLFMCHPDVFGVHRKHSGGVSRTTNRVAWHYNTAQYLTKFKKMCHPTQKRTVRVKIVDHLLQAWYVADLGGSRMEGLKYFMQALLSIGMYTRTGLGLLKRTIQRLMLERDSRYVDAF